MNRMQTTDVIVHLFSAASVLSDAAFTAPVEAEHSEAVGGGAMTICGFELLFVLVLDADHFIRCVRRNKVSKKEANRKKTCQRIKRIKNKM